MRCFLLACCLTIAHLALAQAPDKVQSTIDKRLPESFRQLYDLLSLPNDAHNAGDIEKNIQWCEQAFGARQFKTTRLATPTVPLLLAERTVKKATKTVLVYLQIDGQPVDAANWHQESPWKPALKEQDAGGSWMSLSYEKLYEGYDRDWRIFARSASDAKGPAAAFLTALDVQHDLGLTPNYNLKVIMDFEEELGSPHLPAAVAQYKQALQADMLIIFDGPRHVTNQPTLTFGARGICELTLTTYGPYVPLHSGHYGNYAPNPALRLAQLLASMKDENGRVTIPGFYEGVTITDDEKKILAAVPDDEASIRRKLGIAVIDSVGTNYQESIQYPSLNICGLNSLFVGNEARTLVPATATAVLDIRLVPGSDATQLISLVREHVEKQGYFLTEGPPTDEQRARYPRLASFRATISYDAFRTPFESPCGVWLTRALTRAFGKEPIRIRMGGGSIPISPFVTKLGIPAVIVPTVNADNNQHAENENVRVGNYIDAIRTFTFILNEKL